jgi:hypothetical protein
VKEVKTIVPENNLRGSFEVTGSKGQLIIKFTLSPEADPKIQAFSIARKKE